ncbi:MAG: signal transduction histidine kinase [Gammaproteobacteria bacterium]|jgi:signal transduction histidine kinase
MSNFRKLRKRFESQIVISLWLALASNTWAAGIDKLVDEVKVARSAVESIDDQVNVNEAERIDVRKRYDASVAKLDLARSEILADLSGANAASIAQKRQLGQSWRAISDALHVHPSFIGIEVIDSRPPNFISPISR